MTYAKATLVQQVRYVLQDTPAVDNITAGYTAAGTSLTVADATLYNKGDILEFVADGDTFLVDSGASTTITMKAAGLGWDGSTNANHANGAAFYIRPAYPYLKIVEAIDANILDLWPYAWKSVTDTITPVSGQYYYDAATSTTSAMDLIDATQRTAASANIVRYGEWDTGYPITLERGLPTALATSTVGYYIPYFADYTNTVAVRVRAKLTNTVTSSNYVDVTAGKMVDTLVYGAASRLLENSEFPRISRNDVSMGDATVGPSARLRSAAYFYQRYTTLRDELKYELSVTIPRMPKWR